MGLTILFLLDPPLAALAPFDGTRPVALMPAAGGDILGHQLDLLAELTNQSDTELVFLAPSGEPDLRAWFEAREIGCAWRLLAQPAGSTPLQLLASSGIDANQRLLIMRGNGIVETDYPALVQRDTLTVLVGRAFGHQPAVPVKHSGGRLEHVGSPVTERATAALTGTSFAPKAGFLIERAQRLVGNTPDATIATLLAEIRATQPVATLEAQEWEDATTVPGLLRTNKRLLSVGYGNDDALARSFAEGFTVIPPVFIHDSAEVGSAVIGPYTSVGPNAVVVDAVVRQSIVAANAHVESIVLEGALIGENGHVTGRSHAPVCGDHSTLAFDASESDAPRSQS